MDDLLILGLLVIFVLIIWPLADAVIKYLDKRADYYNALAESLKEKKQ